MKTITEILGGAQALLGINFNLQSYFEEHLTDESTFSRIFAHLAEEGVWSPALDELAKDAHAGKVAYHVCRDSAMVAATESTILQHSRNCPHLPVGIYDEQAEQYRYEVEYDKSFGNPPALPGDSKSLTFKGLLKNLLSR